MANCAVTLYGCALISFLAAISASAQDYAVDWSKIAGGGGTSASVGGIFAVSGTLGQPDADPALTGGEFSLTGGFWSLLAVQTPGAPKLVVTPAGAQAIVSRSPTVAITPSGSQTVVTWPASLAGWTLQTNTTLNPATWGNYTGSVNNNSAAVTLPKGNLFFRLWHP